VTRGQASVTKRSLSVLRSPLSVTRNASSVTKGPSRVTKSPSSVTRNTDGAQRSARGRQSDFPGPAAHRANTHNRPTLHEQACRARSRHIPSAPSPPRRGQPGTPRIPHGPAPRRPRSAPHASSRRRPPLPERYDRHLDAGVGEHLNQGNPILAIVPIGDSVRAFRRYRAGRGTPRPRAVSSKPFPIAVLLQRLHAVEADELLPRRGVIVLPLGQAARECVEGVGALLFDRQAPCRARGVAALDLDAKLGLLAVL